MSTDDKTSNSGIPGEFALIREIFAPLADSDAARGLHDDAAVFAPPPGTDLVVTTDMMTAGVHFRMEDGAASAAARILASNVSDLAAMAAEPLGYTLALAAPRDLPLSWFRAFAAQLDHDQARDGIPLLGGDTTRTEGPLCLSVTAFGAAPPGRAVSRGGARAGDDLWLSGTIGDAFLGLKCLEGEFPTLTDAQRDFLRNRFLFPKPRLDLGELLREYASAAIDISDGLLADVGHIAETSGVSISLNADAIPLSAAAELMAKIGGALWRSMLTGGDDYELAFTAPAAARLAIEAQSRNEGLCLTHAGAVGGPGAEATVRLVARDDTTIAVEGPGGYDHFAGDPPR